MKYILYMLLTINLIFGNDELNSYLNNKKLQHNIINDKKNQRIIIDLLDNENKLIIFSKNSNKFQKIFDNEFYFCKDSNIVFFRHITIEENLLRINCFSNFVDRGQFSLNFFFNSFNNLEKITKQYFMNTGINKSSYFFYPKNKIPTLYDFKNENFANKYLNQNYKLFFKEGNLQKTIQPLKQNLYLKPPKKTRMYLIKGDKVEILEEQDDWVYILYKGKKDIKAWIPKSSIIKSGDSIPIK